MTTVPLPRIAPMKATSGDLPHDEGWAFEVKWDGIRLVAQVDGAAGTLELRTTNDLDATSRFPELVGLPAAVGPHRAVLDGEVVALDEQGRPSFGLLQSRMHITGGGGEVPVSFVLFDLLHLDGSDTTDLPYRDRRRLLEEIVEPGPTWQVAPAQDDGAALLEAARSQGLEGVMAKREESRYEPGKRSRNWIKVKVRRQQEVVVGGWLPGAGGREGQLGSLLVGCYDGAALRYAGRVGTGFKSPELDRLGALLADLDQDDSPFDPPPPREVVRAGARFCRPELVVEVAFAEWTSDGRLRHPSYLGQRIDKDPRDVVREPG
jgi:bifunctional non-homologous end joining protein LigD